MLSGYVMDLRFGFCFTHCLAYVLHVACGLKPTLDLVIYLLYTVLNLDDWIMYHQGCSIIIE